MEHTTNIYDVLQSIIIILGFLLLAIIVLKYNVIAYKYNRTAAGFKVYKERQVTERVRLVSKSKNFRGVDMYSRIVAHEEYVTLMNLGYFEKPGTKET